MARTIVVRLSEANLFAFANEQISVKEPVIEKPKKRFEVGKHYSLQNTEYDGLSAKEANVYELIGVIKQINNIDFESLIMKPIRVSSSMMFSLTKADCQKLGIEYQQGLQLFPTDMGWINVEGETVEEVHEDKEFDDDDLSTYPVDRESRTIQMMTIRLVGFRQEGFDYIRTPEGKTIRKDDFIRTLTIKFKEENEPYEHASQKTIGGRIVTQAIAHTRNGIIVDNESQSIFIEIDLRYKDLSNDRYYGLNPEFLRNKTINDLICIKWEEALPMPRTNPITNDGNRYRGFRDDVYMGLALSNPTRQYHLR